MKTYFIKNAINSYVKIGKSKNPEKRLIQIQSQCNFLKLELFHTIDGDYETKLHRCFKHFRKEGEWFDIPQLDKEMIENTVSNYKIIKPKHTNDNKEMFFGEEIGDKEMRRLIKTNPYIALKVSELPKGATFMIVDKIILKGTLDKTPVLF